MLPTVVAEFAPAAPGIVALPALEVAAVFIVAWALMKLTQQLTDVIFGAAKKSVGWIPWFGQRATGSLSALQKRVNTIFARVVARLEWTIASSWNVASTTIRFSYDAMRETAELGERLAWYVTRKYSLAGLYGMNHTLRARDAVQEKRLDRQADQAAARDRAISHPEAGPIAAGARRVAKPIRAELDWFERWTIPKVRAANRAIAVDLPAEIDVVGEWARAARRAADRANKAIRANSGKLVGLGAIAVVMTALRRLGMGWLKCFKVRTVGSRICGMDQGLLDALLAGLLVLLSPISIVDLARELGAITGEVAEAITEFSTEEPRGG